MNLGQIGLFGASPIFGPTHLLVAEARLVERGKTSGRADDNLELGALGALGAEEINDAPSWRLVFDVFCSL